MYGLSVVNWHLCEKWVGNKNRLDRLGLVCTILPKPPNKSREISIGGIWEVLESCKFILLIWTGVEVVVLSDFAWSCLSGWNCHGGTSSSTLEAEDTNSPVCHNTTLASCLVLPELALGAMLNFVLWLASSKPLPVLNADYWFGAYLCCFVCICLKSDVFLAHGLCAYQMQC